jgi:hypothetical protein
VSGNPSRFGVVGGEGPAQQARERWPGAPPHIKLGVRSADGETNELGRHEVG